MHKKCSFFFGLTSEKEAVFFFRQSSMFAQVIAWTVVACIFAAVIYHFLEPVIIVPPGYAVLLDFLGSYSRVLLPGRHMRLPFFHRARRVNWTLPVLANTTTVKESALDDTFIRIAERVYTFPPLKCTAEDGREVRVSLVISFSISDVKKAVCSAEVPDDLYAILDSEATASLYDVVSGSRDPGNRALLQKQMVTALGERHWSKRYGVELKRTEIVSVDVRGVAAPQHQQKQTKRGIDADVSMSEAEMQRAMELAEAKHRQQLISVELDARMFQFEKFLDMVKKRAIEPELFAPLDPCVFFLLEPFRPCSSDSDRHHNSVAEENLIDV
jgi:regulator of protease activity HflC (stomatin/prohibitin superfamily)